MEEVIRIHDLHKSFGANEILKAVARLGGGGNGT